MRLSKPNLLAYAYCACVGTALAGCTGKKETSEPPTLPIVGTWIRVYPPEPVLDTLVFHANGTLKGGDAVFDSIGFAYTHWKIGSRYSDRHLCVGEGPVPEHRVGENPERFCHPFWILGDTLLLSDTKNTAFLRAPPAPRGRTVTPWKEPRGTFALPKVVDSFRIAPPAASP